MSYLSWPSSNIAMPAATEALSELTWPCWRIPIISSAGNGNGSASPSSGIAETLLAIIGEKTGYPPEMLEMSMDLEADLGIDSIKRVEIMWAFQEKFPDLPQISNSEMGELRTLQQIADQLQNLSPSGESASIAPDMIQASNL